MILAVSTIFFFPIIAAEIVTLHQKAPKDAIMLPLAFSVLITSLIMCQIETFHIQFLVTIILASFFASLTTWATFYMIHVIVFKIMKASKSKIDGPSRHIELLTHIIRNRITFVVFIGLFITMPNLSVIECRMDYRFKTDYFVTGPKYDQILVGKAGDLFICKPVNLTTLKLSDSLVLVKVSEAKPLCLKYKTIGHIKIHFDNLLNLINNGNDTSN